MRADVRSLEPRAVIDADAHASRATENLDQAGVRLEVLREREHQGINDIMRLYEKLEGYSNAAPNGMISNAFLA